MIVIGDLYPKSITEIGKINKTSANKDKLSTNIRDCIRGQVLERKKTQDRRNNNDRSFIRFKLRFIGEINYISC